MMARELAHRPASMFADRGAINIAKTKLFLRLIRKSIWHGYMQKLVWYAVLWVVPSPTCDIMQNSSASSVITSSCLESSHANLMFDRYNVPITQHEDQEIRSEIKEPSHSTRVYCLSSTAKLPSQKVVATVSSNMT